MSFFKILLLGSLFAFQGNIIAQTYPFAKLEGSPVDTAGWFLAGDARIGDTPGDSNLLNDELILCPAANFRSGACFYKKPVNITSCQKWVAEFDFRIWEGTGADGLAFFFLNNPPTRYVNGGGMGIPPKPIGLLVGFDTWQNCSVASSGRIPKIQIRYGNGSRDYSECPSPPQPTKTDVINLRTPVYNHAKIVYDFGNISVYLNDSLQITGFFNINFAGYFGLTASTGGSTDRHSIKNFMLYTQKPLLLAPDAGADRIICNGASTQIGTPENSGNYSYKWYPVAGLSDSSLSNPGLTLSNSTNEPITTTYFVTKDTVNVGEPRCAFADEVKITVLPKLNQMILNQIACSKTPKSIGFNGLPGVQYNWFPPLNLSQTNVSNPSFFAINGDTLDKTWKYSVTASHPAGCLENDTVRLLQIGKFADAGSDKKICGSDSVVLGGKTKLEYNYSWFQLTNNSPSFSSNIMNPQGGNTKAAITINDTLPVKISYRQIVLRQDYNCRNEDTISIQVFPVPIAKALVSKTLCPYDSALIGSQAQTYFSYVWKNQWQLSDTIQAIVQVKGFPVSKSKDTIYYRKRAWNDMPQCSVPDSIVLRFKQLPDIFQTEDKNVCPGDSVILGAGDIAGSGYSYNWLPPQNLSASNLQKVVFYSGSIQNQTLPYVLTNTLEACLISDTVRVKVWNLPEFQAANPFRVCSGISYKVGPDSLQGYQYKWLSSISLSSDSGAKPTFFQKYSFGSEVGINYPILVTESISGCQRTDTIRLILQESPPANAGPDIQICSGDTAIIGVQDFLVDVQYLWSGSGGIFNPQNSPGLFSLVSDTSEDKVLVLRLNSTATGCVAFDTIKLKINALPKVLKPNGRTEICESDSLFTYQFSDPTFPNQSYLWKAIGGNIINQAPGQATVLWSDPSPAIWIHVTDEKGCKGTSEKLLVNVYPKPSGNFFISGSEYLCPGSWSKKSFQLEGNANSTLWFVKGGNFESIVGSSAILNFDSLAEKFQVFALPLSDKSCKGDTVFKTLEVDKLEPKIYSASVIESGKIQVLFSGIEGRSNSGLNFFRNGILERQTVNDIDAQIVENIETKSKVTLFLTSVDYCQVERSSTSHTTMEGKVDAVLTENNLDLTTSWTTYLGANSAIKYELYQVKPKNTAFDLISETNATTLRISNFSPFEEPGFKVKANWFENGISRISWSDEFSTGVQKPKLVFPNLFTPNGDGINDSFFIPYLYWYPNSGLEVFDRWGKSVFKTTNYQNDWEPKDLGDGVYFYHFSNNQVSEKGWLYIKR